MALYGITLIIVPPAVWLSEPHAPMHWSRALTIELVGLALLALAGWLWHAPERGKRAMPLPSESSESLVQCPSCWERSVNPGPGGYRPGECLGCGRRYV